MATGDELISPFFRATKNNQKIWEGEKEKKGFSAPKKWSGIFNCAIFF